MVENCLWEACKGKWWLHDWGIGQVKKAYSFLILHDFLILQKNDHKEIPQTWYRSIILMKLNPLKGCWGRCRIWPTIENCEFLYYALEQLRLTHNSLIWINSLERGKKKKRRENTITTSYSFVVYAFNKDLPSSLKLYVWHLISRIAYSCRYKKKMTRKTLLYWKISSILPEASMGRTSGSLSSPLMGYQSRKGDYMASEIARPCRLWHPA